MRRKKLKDRVNCEKRGEKMTNRICSGRRRKMNKTEKKEQRGNE